MVAKEEADSGKIYLSEKQLPAGYSKWQSLGHFLEHKMRNDSANETILSDYKSGRTYTGAQLLEAVQSVSAALIDLYDFEPRTPVCIAYETGDMSTILVLAVVFCGGTVVCTYPKDPYSELLYMARKVGPQFLFADSNYLTFANQLSLDLGHKVEPISMDEPLDEKATPSRAYFRKWLQFERTNSAPSRAPVACDDVSKQIAFVMMSSGTTGKPKAVPYTHLNCLAELSLHDPKRLRTSLACCASFDYVSGRLLQLDAVLGTYNVVLLNEFEPKTYLEVVEKYECRAIFLGAAAFYNLISYKHIDSYSLASVQMLFPMGSKVLYLDELRRFLERRPHIKVLRQGFGSSETSGVAMNSMTPAEYLRAANNCGRLYPSCRAKIVDEQSGRPLGADEVGILHVAGPAVFPGYYDVGGRKGAKPLASESIGNNNCGDEADKEESAAAADALCLDRSCFDASGFYITGDLAYFDSDERLHLVGRQKELMICRAGKKVLPSELEAVLREHSAVLDVCVLGVADRRAIGSHCPRAFIVPKVVGGGGGGAGDGPTQSRGAEPDACARQQQQLSHVGEHKLCSSLNAETRRELAERLMRFADNQVGWEKQLTGGIVILDRIPTSRATGKHDKNYLRALGPDRIELFGDRSGQFEATAAS